MIFYHYNSFTRLAQELKEAIERASNVWGYSLFCCGLVCAFTMEKKRSTTASTASLTLDPPKKIEFGPVQRSVKLAKVSEHFRLVGLLFRSATTFL